MWQKNKSLFWRDLFIESNFKDKTDYLEAVALFKRVASRLIFRETVCLRRVPLLAADIAFFT